MQTDPFTLSEQEWEYSVAVCLLTILSAENSNLQEKANKLMSLFEKMRNGPEGLQPSLTGEEKNSLSACITYSELIRRKKCDVIEQRYNIKPRLSEEVTLKVNELNGIVEHLNVGAFQKRLRLRNKIQSGKLYISDLHFFHNNIIQMDGRKFLDYLEMNEYMIRQWNRNVTRKDEVFILGDFSIARGRATNEVLSKLNGKKYLIRGNHDKFLEDKEFDRSLLEWVLPYAEIQDNRRKVILSHYPVFCYNGQYRRTKNDDPIAYMLYGHVHNTQDERLVNEFINITKETKVTSRWHEERSIPCNMINCLSVFSKYIPLSLDDWIQLDSKRRNEMTAGTKK